MKASEPQKKAMNGWYHRNADKIKAQRKVKRSSKEWRDWYTKNYAKNRERTIVLARERHRRIRKETLLIYGAKCECCGETRIEFLAFDHINGNGNEHRRSIGKHFSSNMARWLRKNNYPKGIVRILCHNCNLAKGFYGYCPHK